MPETRQQRNLIHAAWRKEVAEWLRGERAGFPSIAAVDAERFVDFVRAEGIAGIIFDKPQAGGPPSGDVFPHRQLAASVYHDSAQALLVMHELQGLSRHFRKAGLSPLIIKGAALAHTHYPAPYLRPLCDTDLLVDRTDTPRLENLLAELGYRRRSAVSGRLVTQQFSMVKSVGGFPHVLDIHVEITNCQMLAGLLPYRALLADAQVIPELGLLTPHPVAALLLACLHRVAHHHGTDRLIWLYDIHLLIVNMPPVDQVRFAKLARIEGAARIAADNVAASHRFFGTTLTGAAHSILRKAARGPAESSAYYLRAQRTRASDLWLDLRYCRSWPARLTLLKETLFPPANYVLGQRANPHPVLLPLYYASRILKGAAKYARLGPSE